MPRESLQQKAERTRKVVDALHRTYPDAHCELNFATPLELLIATILSAQCTDKQVNIVTADLFRKYRSAADYANVPLAEFENDIRRIGLFRSKAKNIQACCRALVEKHGGEVPRTMEELTALGGVGRKTANVVLGNAFGINVGVVVDTHVGRLSQRLGFTRHTAPEKVETDLQKLVPREQWALVSHLLIWHGRRRCFARSPDCPGCEVRDLCPRLGVVSRRVEKLRA
jgi:endonuclease III